MPTPPWFRLLLVIAATALPCLHRASDAPSVLRDEPYLAAPASADDYRRERARLDFHRPNEATAAPVLIWFHGGALKEGDKAGLGDFGPALARAGVATALANYRLHPNARYPDYVADAAEAVAFVKRHAGRLGIDARRVFVGGHSAGAYLAAMLVMDPQHLANVGLTPDDLAGAILLSGQMMTHRTVREERGFGSEHIVADDAAPIFHVRRHTPPLLLLVADRDLPARLEENQYFAAALHAAGHRAATLHVITDRDHGSIGFRIPEPNDPTAQHLIDFVRSTAPSPR